MIKPQSFGNIVSISLLPWGSSEIVSQNLFHWGYVGLICRSKFFFWQTSNVFLKTLLEPRCSVQIYHIFLTPRTSETASWSWHFAIVRDKWTFYLRQTKRSRSDGLSYFNSGAIEENRFFITCWNSVVLNISSVLFNIFLFVSQCKGNHLFAYEKDAFCTSMIVIIITSASIIVLHN